MKKIFSILTAFAALTLLASCQREILQPESPSKVILREPAPGDMAEVSFTVSIPEAGVSPITTKALKEQPDIVNGDIYLALFGLGKNATTGRGGNLQHFLKAKLETPIDHDLTEGSVQHKYKYTVLLPISDEPFVVDFIVGASDANGNLYSLENPPAVDYEEDFMPQMLSRNGVPGYWQRIVIPKVEPQPTASGTGYQTSSDGQDYKAKPISQMEDIQLVRNFASVTFTATTDAPFTINKFVLVDYPKNGDIAPFDAASTVGYKTPYAYRDVDGQAHYNTDYASIVNDTYKYLGFSTLQTLETGINADPTFTNSGEYSFLYERPAPSSDMPESGAIIEVTWKDIDGVDANLKGQTHYYKVAFTGESGYVPILRNIAYNFQISGFNTPTHPTTAGDAYNGSWLGDISANVATANLDEIANSTSKIIVSEMSKTHIGDPTTDANPYKIYFQYYPNTTQYASEVAVVNGTTFHGKNVKVVATIEPVSGYGPAIKSIEQPVADGTYINEATWGRVDVQTYGSGATVKRSKLKILCQLDGQTALYREVIFTVMNKQRFNNGKNATGINSSIDAVEDDINKPTILHLRIPPELPKDLFPLQVRIESQANNLTSIPHGSVGDDYVAAIPVKYGPSVFDSSKNSFYFIKTINWNEYAKLNGETYSYTTEFPCYFKTTLESGNNTQIIIQDIKTTASGIQTSVNFFDMPLFMGDGITVSPESQLVNHDVTSASVRVASSSAWTLGDHEGLTVTAVNGVAPETGATIGGEAGSYLITFSFDANDGTGHVTRTATFNQTGSSLSATATIEQRALVSVTRTIAVNNTNYSNDGTYQGEYRSELGISFTGATRYNNYLGIDNNSTVTFSAEKITSIVITWLRYYNNYYNGNITSNGFGTVNNNNDATSIWTNTSGANSISLIMARRSDWRNMYITSIEVIYMVEQ